MSEYNVCVCVEGKPPGDTKTCRQNITIYHQLLKQEVIGG